MSWKCVGCLRNSEREDEDYEYEVYRRLGVGPFILGLLKGAILGAERAKKLLKETPPWDVKRRKYLRHVIEEGERVRPIYEDYIRRLEEIKEEVRREILEKKLQRFFSQLADFVNWEEGGR